MVDCDGYFGVEYYILGDTICIGGILRFAHGLLGFRGTYMMDKYIVVFHFEERQK
jgi:hypothetical protein